MPRGAMRALMQPESGWHYYEGKMSMSRQPNVVFVLTDDQGYPPLGCHGHPFIQTPHLDRFHDESVHFEQFHTGTTCAPTRAGLMTGHHCNSTGVWHTIGGRSLLRRNEWPLPEALREAGYRTGMFGKWHLGDEYPYRSQDRGFDRVVCHGGGGISQQPDWWGNDYFDDTYWVDGEPKAFSGYCTDVFFAEAMRFIKEDKDRPFFCYLSTNAPHGPFNVASQYRNLYAGKTESEQYARFLGMITNIDENFGKLRRHLQELELEENTVVVFMSDNGQTGLSERVPDQFNAGMRGLKGSPYDGGHRVPFFVRWPAGGYGVAAAVAELTSYVDFMPTILDLCGVDVPPERIFHGESLVPLMRGERGGRWRERVTATDTQRVANPIKWRRSCVMKHAWRLVNGCELYNLETDPGQQHNVASQHPDVMAELLTGYEQWWELCTKGIDQEIPVPVGGELGREALLRSHDLRNEEEHAVVWNQAQVRRGDRCLGWWEIEIEAPGTYEFELRRWPREAGHRLTGAIEGRDVVFDREGVAPGAEGHYSGGTALEFDTATVILGPNVRHSVSVSPEDRGAVVTLDLEPGARHLRALLSSATGDYRSAYYVYARRIA